MQSDAASPRRADPPAGTIPPSHVPEEMRTMWSSLTAFLTNAPAHLQYVVTLEDHGSQAIIVVSVAGIAADVGFKQRSAVHVPSGGLGAVASTRTWHIEIPPEVRPSERPKWLNVVVATLKERGRTITTLRLPMDFLPPLFALGDKPDTWPPIVSLRITIGQRTQVHTRYPEPAAWPSAFPAVSSSDIEFKEAPAQHDLKIALGWMTKFLTDAVGHRVRRSVTVRGISSNCVDVVKTALGHLATGSEERDVPGPTNLKDVVFFPLRTREPSAQNGVQDVASLLGALDISEKSSA